MTNKQELHNKNVVITGASSDLGRAISERFIEQGANSALLYSQDSGYNKLRTLALNNKTDAKSLLIRAELNKENQIESAIETIRNNFRSIDVIIHNAGIYNPDQHEAIDVENVIKQTRIHVIALIKLLNAFLPDMREHRFGRIVAISSAAAVLGSSDPAYATTKNAIIGLTRSIAKKYAKYDITSNVVLPGPIDGGMGKRMPEKRKKEFLKSIPAGRFANIREITEPVLFLCSQYAAYINGICLHINGGLYFAN